MARTVLQPSRFRKALGWAVGISAFIALNVAVLILFQSLGLPIDYEHEPITIHWGRGAESESDGGVMEYVFAAVIASAMAAYRIGLVARTGLHQARLTPRENATFNAWFAGLLAFSGISAGAQFGLAHFERMPMGLVSMASAALVAFACHSWWKRRMMEIDAATHGDR